MLLARTSLIRAAGKSAPPPITTALLTSDVDLIIPEGGYTAVQVEWITSGGDASVYVSPPLDEAGNKVIVVSGGEGGAWGKSSPINIPDGAAKIRVDLDGYYNYLYALDSSNAVIGSYFAKMDARGWILGAGQFYYGGPGGYNSQYGTGFDWTLFEVGGGGAANSNGNGQNGGNGGGGGGGGGAAATGSLPAGRGGNAIGTQAEYYGGGSGARARIGDGIREVNGSGRPGCAKLTWL